MLCMMCKSRSTSKEAAVTETIEDVPAWLAMSDEEFQRGYVLEPDQVPRIFAFHRHPALLGDGVPGPSGPVAWGMQFPGGDLVTVLLSRHGGSGIMHGDSLERLSRWWGARLDAELLWLPRPIDTTLRSQPPA
jgi:hypothetical protein